MMFSLLIAQYNNGKFFADCYKSIIAQTYQNWEAIIVDDCSTDDSVEQMKKLVGNDTRFKFFINQENKGCGFTKKKCAELSTGEICGFLDPDDAISETAIEEMVNKHIELPDVGLIYSNFIFCNENLEPKNIHLQKKIENFRVDFFNLEGEISHFATFKNLYYKKTSGIDDYLQRAVDQDLYFKLYEVGKVFYFNKNFYKYRQHNQGISTFANIEKAYFWKWLVSLNAAKRRNFNIENLFMDDASTSFRQKALEIEINNYNKSIIFKTLRKIGLFKLF